MLDMKQITLLLENIVTLERRENAASFIYVLSCFISPIDTALSDCVLHRCKLIRTDPSNPKKIILEAFFWEGKEKAFGG
jgi:hypothetical protein